MAKPRRKDVGYVLTSRPCTESSLYIDVFCRSFGRVVMVARGARRRQSDFRGKLMAFSPIELRFSGDREIKSLSAVEWLGGRPLPQGRNLILGMGANEIVGKLLPRECPSPRVFDMYDSLARDLSEMPDARPAVRLFEWFVLREMGVAPDLSGDDKGRPIEPGRVYSMAPENLPLRADEPPDPDRLRFRSCLVRGEHLLRLRGGRLSASDDEALRSLGRLTGLFLERACESRLRGAAFCDQLDALLRRVEDVRLELGSGRLAAPAWVSPPAPAPAPTPAAGVGQGPRPSSLTAARRMAPPLALRPAWAASLRANGAGPGDEPAA